MRLDDAEHDVGAPPLQGLRLLQHPVGLADPGGKAQIDLEPPSTRTLDQLEEVLWASGAGVHLESYLGAAD